MIDTIRIRLHSILDFNKDVLTIIKNKNLNISPYKVPEHFQIYEKMLKYKGLYFNLVTKHIQTKESLELLSSDEYLNLEKNKKLTNYHLIQNKIRFVDEHVTNDINERINGKYHLKSSDTNVNFLINEAGSYIDFEFSIPKYLFGHNLAQFIPQIKSRTYMNTPNLEDFLQQRRILHSRLFKFLDKFFIDLCNFFEIDALPDYRFVEIRRIDLCYNQYFESKEDALYYLEEQKKLAKLKETKTTNKCENYKTSLTYTQSNGSYFKIYHKGSEYINTKNGDFDKHMKINRDYINKVEKMYPQNDNYQSNKNLIWNIIRKGTTDKLQTIDKEKLDLVKPIVNRLYSKLPYKVLFLKNEMDKVLRYEVSLKSNFFRYSFKTKLFRKNCPIHKNFYDIYKRVHSEYYRQTPSDVVVGRRSKAIYNTMNKFLCSSVHMMLKTTLDYDRHNTTGKDSSDFSMTYYDINKNKPKTILGGDDIAFFSSNFLSICLDHFQSLINRFQIKQINNFDDIRVNIKNYNARCDLLRYEYNIKNMDMISTKVLKPYKVDGISYIMEDIIYSTNKSGKRITLASQLLSQKQQIELGFQKVNITIILSLLERIKKGESLDQICTKDNINSSTKSRYKRDLNKFGIEKNSLNLTKKLLVKTDFFDYYCRTRVLDYSKQMFSDINLLNIS